MICMKQCGLEKGKISVLSTKFDTFGDLRMSKHMLKDNYFS